MLSKKRGGGHGCVSGGETPRTEAKQHLTVPIFIRLIEIKIPTFVLKILAPFATSPIVNSLRKNMRRPSTQHTDEWRQK